MTSIIFWDHVIVISWWKGQYCDICTCWYVTELAIAQANDESLSSQLAQAVVLPTVAGACHVFMHGLNLTEVCISFFLLL